MPTIEYIKNDDMDDHFIIYHQNIRGLKNKINELLISLTEEMPHVLCLTEHYLKGYELLNMHIPKLNYVLNIAERI